MVCDKEFNKLKEKKTRQEQNKKKPKKSDRKQPYLTSAQWLPEKWQHKLPSWLLLLSLAPSALGYPWGLLSLLCPLPCPRVPPASRWWAVLRDSEVLFVVQVLLSNRWSIPELSTLFWSQAQTTAHIVKESIPAKTSTRLVHLGTPVEIQVCVSDLSKEENEVPAVVWGCALS